MPVPATIPSAKDGNPSTTLPHWSSQRAYDAFIGYSLNQRKKFLDKKDGRPEKYAAAYIQVLHNLCDLLETGAFTVRIVETPIGKTIERPQGGAFRTGEVVDLGEHWADMAARLLPHCNHKADPDAVDHVLIRLRKAFLA